MHIEIWNKPFDPWQSVRQYQDTQLAKGCYGALSLFVGTMRDFNAGDDVREMEIEHYHGMTEQYLRNTVEQLIAEHDVEDILVIHRVGTVCPGDPIVAVAVWSAHREEAYAANRAIVEKLKTEIPFWKKEVLVNEKRWVTQKEQTREA